jgi:membrane peptidoglycan carboxypeptidase
VLKGKKTLADPATGSTGGAIGIGQYEVRPVDQAVGFASFAAGGVQRDAYVVAKVTDSEGKVLLQNNGSAGKQVMPPDVAHDVTYALEGVAAWSKRALQGNRPVASKTGTQGQNGSAVNDTDAWMVGYTPSISAAVWMGSDKGNDAIKTAAGKPIYGAGLPGQIWQQFMNTVLKGAPVEKLPTSPVITGDTGTPINPVVVTPTATATSSAPSTQTQAPTSAAATTTPPAPVATTSSAPTTTAPSDTSSPASVGGGLGGVTLPGSGRSSGSKTKGSGGGGGATPTP